MDSRLQHVDITGRCTPPACVYLFNYERPPKRRQGKCGGKRVGAQWRHACLHLDYIWLTDVEQPLEWDLEAYTDMAHVCSTLSPPKGKSPPTSHQADSMPPLLPVVYSAGMPASNAADATATRFLADSAAPPLLTSVSRDEEPHAARRSQTTT